jgi:hypothetical protein
VTTVASAHDQQLVPCYTASVFMSFRVGLLAMARLARRKWRHKSAVINPIAAIAAAFSSPSSRIPGAGSRAASPAFAADVPLAPIRAGDRWLVAVDPERRLLLLIRSCQSARLCKCVTVRRTGWRVIAGSSQVADCGIARQRMVGPRVENPSARGRRQTDGPR